MRRVIRQLRDRLVRRLLLAADRLAAEAEDQARERPDPVQRLSRDELEARADRIAARLGVSRARAFEMLARGELHGKLAEPELYMVRSLLDASEDKTWN